MPTQYIRVRFPVSRVVEVDDTPCGQTNQVLMLEEGTLRITLEGEPDYAPSFLEQVFQGTTPAAPLELVFGPASAREAAADAEHEAADAAFDEANADGSNIPSPEELRHVSDTGKPTGKE